MLRREVAAGVVTIGDLARPSLVEQFRDHISASSKIPHHARRKINRHSMSPLKVSQHELDRRKVR